MAVREQDGVDAAHAERERLRAQIRPRIHQQRVPGVGLDEHGRAPAAIARVGGAADAAVAADHRHAVGGAGSEEGDLQLTVR
jgi:hypothetical protein